jgi:hypothetical protein
MSTRIYLECMQHTPPLRNPYESGQHAYNIPMICDWVKNRDQMVAWFDDHDIHIDGDEDIHFLGEQMAQAGFFDPNPDGSLKNPWDDVYCSYFAGATAGFLAQHRDCPIGIYDTDAMRYINPTTGDYIEDDHNLDAVRNISENTPRNVVFTPKPARVGDCVQFNEYHKWAGAFGVITHIDNYGATITCPVIDNPDDEAATWMNSQDNIIAHETVAHQDDFHVIGTAKLIPVEQSAATKHRKPSPTVDLYPVQGATHPNPCNNTTGGSEA